MKNIYIFLSVALIGFALQACTTHGARRRLERIDSLICAQMADSAYAELKTTDASALSDADRAYYGLLATKAAYIAYKPLKSDSAISRSLEYYKTTADNGKLGEAYYYKGMTEQLLGHTDSAIINLKEAESIAATIDDIGLRHKVYNGLASLNYATANYALAMEYARKELAAAESTRDTAWLANACNHMACAHYKMGNKDSARHYIKRLIPYTDNATEDTRAYYLSNIGQYYLHAKDTPQAKRYLAMSYNTKPIAETVNMLSRIYYSEHDSATAFSLLRSAAATTDPDSRIKIYETLAYLYYSSKDYKATGAATLAARRLRDSLMQARRPYAMHELQMVYDSRKNTENRQRARSLIAAAAAMATIAAAAGICLYRRRRSCEKKNTQIMISEYERRISRLETTEDGLNRKLAEMRHDSPESLSDGYALYKEIASGGTTVQWNKRCFENFVRYYKVVSPAFVQEMEDRYNGLSAVNKSLLIMQHMGFTNGQIRQALGMSAGALRAARFRIKAKEKNPA